MKQIIKTCVKKIPVVNTLAYKYRDHLIEKQIDIKRDKISELMANVPSLSNPKNILFWSNGGMPDLTNLDATYALALQLRGHNVHVIICDGLYKACIKREIAQQEAIEFWSSHCGPCKKANSEMLKQFNVPFSYVGDWISELDLENINHLLNNLDYAKINDLEFEGIKIGPNIESSFLRYTKGVELRQPVVSKNAEGKTVVQIESDEKIMREYAFSAMINILSAKHCFSKTEYHKVFMSHGVYIEWGSILKLALKNNISVTGWLSSIVPKHFVFRNITSSSSINILHMDDSTYDEVKAKQLTTGERNQLQNYFKKRYNFNLFFPPKLSVDKKTEICSRFNIEMDKPIWGILAHINWDSVRDGTPMLYDSFNEWIIDTINVIKDIKDVHWTIKIHPDERNHKASYSVMNVIKEAFTTLPSHITIFPPDAGVSINDFSDLVEGAVTVYSTLGLELALFGKPVVMAGYGHYGKKGFTLDARDKQHYYELLNQVMEHRPLTEQQLNLAYTYAHYFFIRRQIPIPIFDHDNPKVSQLDWDKLENLLPGRDPFMDMICDRIIDNKPIDLDVALLEKKGLTSELV